MYLPSRCIMLCVRTVFQGALSPNDAHYRVRPVRIEVLLGANIKIALRCRLPSLVLRYVYPKRRDVGFFIPTSMCLT
jgi:hypothetical protein